MKTPSCLLLAFLLGASVLYADPAVAQQSAIASNPPPATGPEDWVTLYSGIAKMIGVAVTDAEVRSAVANRSGAGFQALSTKIRAPYVEQSARLFRADIDNDGTQEYVVCYTHETGEHPDYIAGVFRPQAGSMVQLQMPLGYLAGPSPHGMTHQASPFLSLDREGVTMRFVEDDGHFRLPEDARIARYLWRGGIVRLLDRVPIPQPSVPAGVRTTPPMRCSVITGSSTFVAGFDYSTMTGTVVVDGAVGPRRFNVRAAPYNATYNLVFLGYGPGDQKPALESMTRMTSVVARLVSWSDDKVHLFLNNDYHPAMQAGMEGFVCQ